MNQRCWSPLVPCARVGDRGSESLPSTCHIWSCAIAGRPLPAVRSSRLCSSRSWPTSFLLRPCSPHWTWSWLSCTVLPFLLLYVIPAFLKATTYTKEDLRLLQAQLARLLHYRNSDHLALSPAAIVRARSVNGPPSIAVVLPGQLRNHRTNQPLLRYVVCITL